MFSNLLEINSAEEEKKIVQFLKTVFAEQKIEKAVVGISGGVDSATSLTLISKVLPRENIIAIHLPYFDNTDSDVDALSKSLGISIENISIKEMTDKLTAELNIPQDDQVRRGNVMARVRMIALYDIAKKNNALVVGTENRSEFQLGYFTRFGDEASDIEPLQHLYKTQLIELAKHLGLPDSIINNPPSANLWENQTDEGEFGFTYQEADPVLYLYFDKKNPLWTIESMNPGAKKIIEFAEKNQFKHRVPYHL
ncbi:MAG: NAD synthetase [uncultured bacterium]|nr:MAG: NAD synthetase [uncultured bacterium]